MALKPTVGTHVECLARAAHTRRRDVDGVYDAAGAPDAQRAAAAALVRREARRRPRENKALAQLEQLLGGALGSSDRPVLVRGGTKPPPAGSVDEAAAAALGVPPASEFHSLPFAGIPEVAAPLKAALADAYRLWPTLTSSRAKFDDAFAEHLQRAQEGAREVGGAAAQLPLDTELLATVRAWRVLVLVLWASDGADAALRAVRTVVGVDRRVADRAAAVTNAAAGSSSVAPAVTAGDTTDGGRRVQQPPAAGDDAPRTNAAAPAAAAAAVNRFEAATVVRAQAYARRWIARCRVADRRANGDDDTQRALRRLFAAAAKGFGQRRDAAAALIDVVTDVESTQRRVDAFWENEEAEYKRQWANWERGARTFYFDAARCPIDPSEWAYDSKAAAAGGRDVFVHLATGRRTEEHPNTNKFVAARGRERMKAERQREARRAAAESAEEDARKLWQAAAEPALKQLAQPGPSLPP